MINIAVTTEVAPWHIRPEAFNRNDSSSIFVNQTLSKFTKSASNIVLSTALIGVAMTSLGVGMVSSITSVPSHTPLGAYSVERTDEFYSFKNRDEVSGFIVGRDDVKGFLKSFPNLIRKVSEEAKVTLSIFTDLEEGWQNLYVEIKTGRSLEELDLLEDQLFSFIKKDNLLQGALTDMIISFS